MTADVFRIVALDPGLSLLPPQMDTPEARVMIVAICQQESGLVHRFQMGGGPARGFAQFELAGVRGVMKHERTIGHARSVCRILDIEWVTVAIHTAIAYNDPLCVAFARLLLWTLPEALPALGDQDEAWRQYLDAWRPGKPRPDVWPYSYQLALDTIEATP